MRTAPVLRFGPGSRYGAGLVGMLFAAYLATATDFSAIVQSEQYAGTIRNDAPIVDVVQYLVIVGVMVTSLVLLPTSGMRRLLGVTIVCVVFFLWAALGLLRGAGSIGEPAGLWSFVLNQGFVTLLAAVAGWVTARGRHPATWFVALVAVIPPLVLPGLVAANITTGGYALVEEGLVVAAGLGAVWLAAWLDTRLGRRAAKADSS